MRPTEGRLELVEKDSYRGDEEKKRDREIASKRIERGARSLARTLVARHGEEVRRVRDGVDGRNTAKLEG